MGCVQLLLEILYNNNYYYAECAVGSRKKSGFLAFKEKKGNILFDWIFVLFWYDFRAKMGIYSSFLCEFSFWFWLYRPLTDRLSEESFDKNTTGSLSFLKSLRAPQPKHRNQ